MSITLSLCPRMDKAHPHSTCHQSQEGMPWEWEQLEKCKLLDSVFEGKQFNFGNISLLEVTVAVGSPAAEKRFDTGLWHTHSTKLLCLHWLWYRECGSYFHNSTAYSWQILNKLWLLPELVPVEFNLDPIMSVSRWFGWLFLWRLTSYIIVPGYFQWDQSGYVNCTKIILKWCNGKFVNLGEMLYF